MREEKLLFKKFGRVFPPGTLLFEEGQDCSGMYIIQKGCIRLFKKAGPQEITIDILKEGDFFGEMACLLGQPRSINAVVEEESRVLVVEPEVLEELFREKTGLGIKILGNLASRLRRAYDIIGRLAEE
jgi:CRP/FNR family transcriptional regulator, cyclic AMP receptor protein